MSALFRTQSWIFVYELVRAWAPQLSESANNLRVPLLKDIREGNLDGTGPLAESKRSGLRLTTTSTNEPKPITGRQVERFISDNLELPSGMTWSDWLPGWGLKLLDLRNEHLSATAGELFICARLELTKRATLDFARRHELHLPSWWRAQSGKREQCLLEDYRHHWDATVNAAKRQPSRAEDDAWAKNQNFSTGSVRERRKEFINALPADQREFIQKGGSGRSLPGA